MILLFIVFCVRTVVPNITNFFSVILRSYGIKNGDAVLPLPFIIETHEYYCTSTTIKFRDIQLKCMKKEVYRNKFQQV